MIIKSSITISFFLICLFFMAVSLPLIFSILLAIIILTLFIGFKIDHISIIFFSLSLLFLIIISETSLGLLTYNPASSCAEDEFKIPGKEHYKKNKSIYGFLCKLPDIVKISGDLSLVEKVSVDFVTDKFGYRNYKEFNKNDLVIIGDSFTVGVGTTQDHILSEQMSELLNKNVYNASFPTHPGGYFEIWKRMHKLTSQNFKSIFLIFEGNDFFCTIEEVYSGQPPQTSFLNYTFNVIQNTQTYNFSYGLFSKVASYYNLVESPLKVDIRNIGGNNVGFLDWYISVSEREEHCNKASWDSTFSFLEVIDNVELIVFIPTKYRVYHHMLSDKELPKLQSEYLKNFAENIGINYLDLSEYLINSSNKLIKNGNYTFGRGDTHWNSFGIKVAAETIVKKLEENKN